ncbi:Hercynine oxygenase [Trichoplax sp. H2]|nr:Hercynine oxygenase [Trichoplax sp. H2]|eukprot:RDD47828.1 Hercynine oxygenase [Trichoplax sp. H2]
MYRLEDDVEIEPNRNTSMVGKDCRLTGSLACTSSRSINLSNCSRNDIREYFINGYDLDETLFTSLKDESSFYCCPDRLRLPLIFYYGHTAAVLINKLMLAGLIKERVDLEIETLMETGVDEMSWDDTENYRMGGNFKWPSVKDILDYRAKVRKVVLDVIDTAPLVLPITQDSPWWAVMLGLDHERIHFETSSVLIRQMPVDLVTKPVNWNYGPLESSNGRVYENPFIRVDGSVVKFGKSRDFPSFGWDNEYGEATVEVPSFEAQEFPVTNYEFLKFVKAGGYDKKEFWTDEGWHWKEYREAKHPTFWVCNEGCKSGCGASLASYSHCNGRPQNGDSTNGSNSRNGQNCSNSNYRYRAIFDVLDMPLDWPVEVNYHEAKAYCSWLGQNYRLPTEAEYRLMLGRKLNDSALFPRCDMAFESNPQCNINMKYCSSTPVNLYGPSSAGFYDIMGNVWEWAEDHFNGLPGFKSHYVYHDFSTPCFDGRHNMIMYGSWASTGGLSSCYARFAFRRHFFQHMGFRVVRHNPDANIPVRLVNAEVFVLGVGVEDNEPLLKNCDDRYVSSTNEEFSYDTIDAVNEIILSQFGNVNVSQIDGVGCENGSAELYSQVDNIWIKALKEYGINTDSALDIGCGVGRNSFELAKYFHKVVGIDFGGRLIDTALKAKKTGEIKCCQDGHDEIVIKTDSTINRDKITFMQLTWLPNEICMFDFVLLTHLNRVANDKAWILRLKEVVNTDGLVVAINYDRSPDYINSLVGKWFNLRENYNISYRKACKGQICESSTSITIWQRNAVIA